MATLNKEMYIDILRRLMDAVRRKRPEKLRTNFWFVFYDNAPAHRSVLFKVCLAKKKCDSTGASPTLFRPGYGWLLPVPSTEISIEGTGLV